MSRVWMIVPAVLLLPACGGSGKNAAPSSPPLQTVTVSEQEFSITPKTLSVSKPGVYAFSVSNNGMITHAFEIEGNGVEEKTGDIAAGSTATLKVDLSKRGSYDAYCPIDGHRSKGMEATLTVGAASSGTGGGASSTTKTTTTTTSSTSTTGGYGYGH